MIMRSAMFAATSLALLSAAPASAQQSRASAEGSVVIERPVGSGIAFNVLTASLSSVFLSGRSGDAVSLTSGASSAETVVLSADTYPVSLQGRGPAAGGGNPSNLLFLAQFN